MLDALITSKTRIKLLLKFFLNSKSSAYLRNLETEFGESTNAIRLELNRFEQAGMLETFSDGNKKMYRANTKHPMFGDIQNLLRKFVGIDQIIDKVIHRLGNISKVYVTGDFARGCDSMVIDLLIIADCIDRNYLTQLIEKTEPLIARKIRYAIMQPQEYTEYKAGNGKEARLLIYSDTKP